MPVSPSQRRWRRDSSVTWAALLGAAAAGLALAAAQPAAAQSAQGVAGCSVERLQRIMGPSGHVASADWAIAAKDVPAHCAVAGYIERDGKIGFTLGLPEAWNNKFLFIGVGGFAGYEADLSPGLKRGYATASTDSGHKGKDVWDATWALGDLPAVRNHFETAFVLVPVAMKQATSAYYGAAPAHAYWDGCSGGGRQGMMAAERFPDMFDGIIAGAPAWNYSKLFIGFLENGKLVAQSAANWVSPETFQAIDREVLRQCDKLDGLVDGVVSDPRACRPDLSVLRCKPSAVSASCLTEAQLAVLEKIQRPRYASPNSGLYGYRLSGQDAPQNGWPFLIFGERPATARPGEALYQAPDTRLGTGYFANMIKQDAKYDWQSFKAETDGAALEQWADLTNADKTDLSRYFRRGGKLILWHGWADPAIPGDMSIDLYGRILRDTKGTMTPPLDQSVRLFMAPGLQHCYGGSGFTEFDRLTALESWVEKGQAPAAMIATQLADGRPRRTRPLCAYPKTATYTGAGSQDDAASFVCR
jgi:feruloyl esterase